MTGSDRTWSCTERYILAELRLDGAAYSRDRRSAEVITRLAHTKGADLIMMPTHGYGPFRSLLLGRLPPRFCTMPSAQSDRGSHGATLGGHLAGVNVLCAIDATPQGVPLIKAAEYAKLTGTASAGSCGIRN
jgi:hypothetical protein